MEFFELIKKRRSVRSFSTDSVDKETVLRVLDAGRLAPSACNNQPWIYIVVREKDRKLQLSSIYNREWFYTAPVIIAVCCNRKESWHRKDGKDFGDIDIAITLDHMTLAAQELGLGTCWIGNFTEQNARTILNLPEYIDPVAFTPLGYPEQESQSPKIRKSLDEITYYECFDQRND